MINPHLLDELTRRGLVAQNSDPVALADHLATPRTVYCGFDPTAGSLHIGHLVPLLMLRRFQLAGHTPVALVGGATGLIGDPSFKATERNLNSSETVQGWVASLSAQIKALLPASEGLAAPLLVNNADWMGQMSALDFLRDIGKHFSVNAMLVRESVRQRLARPDQGISFTEFSYALLQSQDYAVLNQRLGCTLQIGGNDQWGNITSGMDLTRRLHQAQVYGMTLPLITKADGTKFGKTEGGAIWLDPALTSPYAFYQFWLGTADEDVYRFLRYYSFMPLTEIEALEAEDAKRQGRKLAQQVLADELTELVHGKGALAAAQRISELLFSGEVARLGESDLAQLAQDGMPGWRIEGETDLVTLLVESGLANSKRIARELLAAGAISLNGEIRREEPLRAADRLFGRHLLLRRGKKQYRLVTWQG
ncbi:tyrosine--tRNA ligase [Aeromonas hydrophila]|uniref:Tyrosine--tRNA ligase n=1 Tax=Aeromonas hydrophila subsp. hydrophila (strain ATCC 7966 / DSM 30187 / BCRC 13018 / CCUG 14551 / JCM 1027 / KCTC 2358 / NCIMB 9240 / NCTC 8049) TaxID=380703 RepID=SYY_AERHH|nr:tyrosine--tRNA ligase [Aeromonas hydrophila]A0KFT8.1 RecName: Full=Tyrosine--tRNA ligase; AltName: Full=Tyrosyl-tRNA synthetase; Short=TyrRS [Aeromonas hydrophila subsp. hydrophila ATCC 7966]ABK39461.1 tyrosyl-tRNA synthetase [Aeromonas hydrophila subsp. hydrophila ATCC 7966]MBS4673112.1 tyrosine--tRNA ligase [Aeromonas hydrophila]OOD36490.1 tyrosine--tRNA ligase [Aeromonas hydrophila]SUU16214.1 tyrosyl-tRNA synthetase [Aeromonas hydrophila]